MSRRPCPQPRGRSGPGEEERKTGRREKKEKEKKEEEEEEEGVREETRANAPVPAAEIGGEAGGASVTTSVTTSAMAAMMGTTPTNRGSEPIAAPVVTAAAVAPGEVPRSSMARLLSAPSAPSAPSSAPAGDDDDDDEGVGGGVSRRRRNFAPRRCLRRALPPLAPRQGRGRAVEPVPASGTKRVAGGLREAQRKNKEEAERAAVAAIEDGAGDVVTGTPGAEGGGRQPKRQNKGRCAGDASGGYTRPPRFARAPSASVRKREAQREEAEREAVVKARAEEARNVLASRRKAAMASMMDSSDESTNEDRALARA